MLTIYSLPNCSQCEMTKKLFNREGLEYKEVMLSEDAEAAKAITDLGYKSAPVVFYGEEHWSGFRPDRIMKIAKTN